MTDELSPDLEKRIKQRQELAQARGIFHKAITITAYLGSGADPARVENTGMEYEIDCSFKNKDFSIHHQAMGRYFSDGYNCCSSVEIKYRGKKVFEDRACYIPGDWEKKFETLAVNANKIRDQYLKEQQRKKEEEKKKHEDETRKQWGL
jgi:hypothetical protein